jgi:hypothetical protein
MTSSQHVYEVRPRKDKRGFDLISDALPFGRLWYGEPDAASNAIGYAVARGTRSQMRLLKAETAHDAKREIIGQVVCSCVFFSSGLLANRRDTSQQSE